MFGLELGSDNTMKEMVKFSVEYYDKFSVISGIDDDNVFLYFPNMDETIEMGQYSIDSSLINTLEVLPEGDRKSVV